jgi:hypothetical protein
VNDTDFAPYGDGLLLPCPAPDMSMGLPRNVDMTGRSGSRSAQVTPLLVEILGRTGLAVVRASGFGAYAGSMTGVGGEVYRGVGVGVMVGAGT